MKPLHPKRPLYIIDDEEHFLQAAEMFLMSEGITHIVLVSDATKALELFKKTPPYAVILDVTMPGITGLELLPLIKEEYPTTPVLMLTAHDDVSMAVSCIQAGATNYLLKPIDETHFSAEVQRVIEEVSTREENENIIQKLLENSYEHDVVFDRIITKNTQMKSLFVYIEAIATSPQPVLISGETGTGKEMIAESLHLCSGRRGAFITCNVAGLDDTLFSDTLFGHVKGAFTGADTTRMGLIEEAQGGTLFLDEIGDLSLSSQIKLLRLLQQHEYHPLGADRAKKSSARIVVATNVDINQLQKDKQFRTDLYFRLKTHRVELPPLRKRKDDIELLCAYFMEKAAALLGKKTPTVPAELYPLLRSYSFPGNIRELESMVFDAVSRHSDHIMSLDSFKQQMDMGDGEVPYEEAEKNVLLTETSFPTIKGATRFLIAEALRRTEGNQSQAARMLGITRQALNQRLKTLEE